MQLFKNLTSAAFLIFLCLVPIVGMAQEEVARLLDVPNVEDDRSNLAMTKALRNALSDAGHLVFSEEEMVAATKDAGVSSTYWLEPEQIASVNKIVRHDAVVRVVNQSSKAIVYVYNAYTGELVAEMERRLKKRNKMTNADAKAIARGVSSVAADIVPIQYKDEITIVVTSTPAGASVLRGGIEIGKTPFEYKIVEQPNASEQWVIAHPDYDPATQLVAFDKSGNYDVVLQAKASESSSIGVIPGGDARPVLAIGFNAAPTIRSLDASADKGSPISYRARTFATYSFDVEFYPFPLFLDVDYLQGLGIIFNVGFGFLDTDIQVKKTADSDMSCRLEGKTDDNGVGSYVCDTSYLRIRAGINYKLLLQHKDNRLDPNGMALDFIVAYNYTNFDVDSNPLYMGHDYSGFNFGVRFSAPLGLKELRATINADMYINGGNGNIDKTTKWGTSIESSLGMSAGLTLTYDIWHGFYVRVGYNFTLMSNDYAGNGSLGASKSEPVNAKSTDMYHEILMGIGYMLF